MKLYAIHIGEADLDTGTQVQRCWVVPEEVAATIAQSLGESEREYVASEDQADAMGRGMTDAGVAVFETQTGGTDGS